MILKGQQWGMLGRVKMSNRLCRDWHEGSDTQNGSSAKGYVRKEWRAVTFVCIATLAATHLGAASVLPTMGYISRYCRLFAFSTMHLPQLKTL